MEYVDIFDDNRDFTGKVVERHTKLTKGEYSQYVLVLIRCNGKYLVTQRALDKKWAAGSWEIPGGGVTSGETPVEAIIRECKEETGITIDNPTLLYSYKNEDLKSGDNYFCDIFMCDTAFGEEEIKVQAREIINYRLVSFEQIKELHQTDGFLHYERIMKALENA